MQDCIRVLQPSDGGDPASQLVESADGRRSSVPSSRPESPRAAGPRVWLARIGFASEVAKSLSTWATSVSTKRTSASSASADLFPRNGWPSEVGGWTAREVRRRAGSTSSSVAARRRRTSPMDQSGQLCWSWAHGTAPLPARCSSALPAAPSSDTPPAPWRSSRHHHPNPADLRIRRTCAFFCRRLSS